jgi:hypothetical protein
MIPSGREVTKAFSPTRRHLIANEEKRKVCVCCNRSLRPTIPFPSDDDKKCHGSSRRGKREITDFDMEEGKDNNDDDPEEIVEEEEKEELRKIPNCEASEVAHFAHEKCIKKLDAAGAPCPRCMDIKKRVNFDSPNMVKRYCQHIVPFPGLPGGFTGSSKINAVVDWYHGVPKTDKVGSIQESQSVSFRYIVLLNRIVFRYIGFDSQFLQRRVGHARRYFCGRSKHKLCPVGRCFLVESRG